MPEFTPRPYQVLADKALKHALRTKPTALLVAPCAAGKTYIFIGLIKWLHAAGKRCLVLLDRNGLVEQTADKLIELLGPDAVGIACASVSRDKDLLSLVTVASRQTLAPMLQNGSASTWFNLVIIDEVHLCQIEHKGQYKTILDVLKRNHPDVRVMGCTATPYRLKGGYIYGATKMFDKIDFQITTEELLDAEYIVPLDWRVRKSDLNAALDAVKKSSTGELDEAGQMSVIGTDIYVNAIYDVWLEMAGDRKTAIFALNIAHAVMIEASFREKGVKTWIIHSKMPNEAVKRAVWEFSTGSGVMINVGILTIGSDIPSISCIILARRTLSTALFFQIVGRGARLDPPLKRDCRIIDLCGNAIIHGNDPDNPIRQVTKEKDSEPAMKVCPMCETPCSLNARKCKGFKLGTEPPEPCGFEFPYEEPEAVELAETTSERPELVAFGGYDTVKCSNVRYYYHKRRAGQRTEKRKGLEGEYGLILLTLGRSSRPSAPSTWTAASWLQSNGYARSMHRGWRRIRLNAIGISWAARGRIRAPCWSGWRGRMNWNPGWLLRWIGRGRFRLRM